MRQRASTDGWPTAQRIGISGSKTKWPVYTRRFAESSTGVDNWAIRRQLTEKRANRGFGCAGTETTRGTTDIAAYRSKFRHVPSPESGVSRSLVVRGFRDRNQFVNATASRRTDPDFVGFGRVP